MAAYKVAWIQKLLIDMGEPLDRAIVIFCDNMSSIYLASVSC